MFFALHVPTRGMDSIEVRVRSDRGGPVAFELGGQRARVDPVLAHGGRYFFRWTFGGLAPETLFEVAAVHLETGTQRRVTASTLRRLPGARKLRLGLLPDLHLSLDRKPIDAYRPGSKRLYGLSHELTARYLERAEQLGAEALVLLGDLVEPCTRETLRALSDLLGRRGIPCYPIIGNHEPWSPRGEALFHEVLGLPPRGYYAVSRPGLRLLMLSTPTPAALHPRSEQYEWLCDQLTSSGAGDDVLLFSHFSLVLHPCVRGPRNDGYQLLEAHRELLELIARFPNVRLFSAGHKNVPSRVALGHTLHLLSPQLIQAPCGYDLLDLHEGGLARTTFEIDEQHYAEVARAAYESEGPLRFGTDEDRCFVWEYP